jgi:hypothetical protein
VVIGVFCGPSPTVLVSAMKKNDSAPIKNSGKRPGRDGDLDELIQPHPDTFLAQKMGRFSGALPGKLELAGALGLLKNPSEAPRLAANFQRLGIRGCI